MPSDNWMEETIPSRRSEAGEGGYGSTGPGRRGVPTRVWVFASVVGIVLFALLSFGGLYLLQSSRGPVGPTPTAIVWTATPSPIPDVSPTPTVTATPVMDEQPEPEPTPTVSAEIQIGGYVQVTGTGAYGLSLRDGPGANYARMDVAADGETFVVVEGPQTVAGEPWWRIRDPDNEARFFWAIGTYLRPVPRP